MTKKKSFVDNSPMKSKSQRSVKLTAKKKLNPVIIAVISAIILAGTVIAAVIVKNSNSNNNDNDNSISTVDEAPSFSINNTCDTVAVTSVSPSTAAKSRDRTQSVVGSYDKSKSKIQESDNTAKSSENKSDKSDNKSKSNNINDDDNTDAYTKNDNQKMILIIMMIIIIKNTAVLSYLMKATAIKILTVMRSAVLSSTTIQKLYGLAIR